MPKEKFERKNVKEHANVNVGTIGRVDHGQTMWTPTLTTVMAKSFSEEFKFDDQIDNSQEEQERDNPVTILG